jgi:hypothetical protein
MKSPIFVDETLLRETTPEPEQLIPALEAFVKASSAETAVFVPVVPSAGAEPGWCYRNVARAVAAGGGTPVHGWTIWTSDLFATAEFHVVLRKDDGEMIDVTPKRDGERAILFAVDPSRGADFDFMRRPPNRRTRLYRGLSAERRTADLIACMSDAEIRAGTRRAEKSGMSLEGFVASRMKPDPLEVAIDRFLACCDQAEAMLRPTPEGQWCDDIPCWRELEARKVELLRRLARIWETHPARSAHAAPGGLCR